MASDGKDAALIGSVAAPPLSDPSVWSGFHRKSMAERLRHVNMVFPELPDVRECDLDLESADLMVENCIGTLSLPLAIATNLVVNGTLHVVPMAVEEPSVVAAVSGISKLVSKVGGFTASSSERNIMTAQIQIIDVPDLIWAKDEIDRCKEELLQLGDLACPNMVARGGGVVDIETRITGKNPARSCFLIVHVHVDVCEAMGANTVTTVAEYIAVRLEELSGGGTVVGRILTNLCNQRKAMTSFQIPIDYLAYKGFSGHDVANRILSLYEWAECDIFRAATHNKGIMNGIDAVAIATGQDWRSIEASAHAYAAQGENGYTSLSRYWVEDVNGKGQCLCGELILPLAVGTRGGVLAANPLYTWAMGLLSNPDAQTLAKIMVSVGLAQNFAALRALATEGLQRGHMSLHARNIAVAAGAPPHAVPEVVSYMLAVKSIHTQTAKEYLNAHAIHERMSRLVPYKTLSDVDVRDCVSVFVVPGYSIDRCSTPEHGTSDSVHLRPASRNSASMDMDIIDPQEMSINVAFPSPSGLPVHITLGEAMDSELHSALFSRKSSHWLSQVLSAASSFRLNNRGPLRSNYVSQMRLKTVSLLINLLAKRLVLLYPKEFLHLIRTAVGSDRFALDTGKDSLSRCASHSNHHPSVSLLYEDAYSQCVAPLLSANHQTHKEQSRCVKAIGCSLLLTLWRVFEFEVKQRVTCESLCHALLREQCKILNSLAKEDSSAVAPPDTDMDELFRARMSLHKKRVQVSIFLLCDAMSLDAQLLSLDAIDFIGRVGRHYEWIATIAHDLTRYQRSSEDHQPNIYMDWLKWSKRVHSKESMRQFYIYGTTMQAEERALLLRENNNNLLEPEVFGAADSAALTYYNLDALLSNGL